MQLKLDNPIGLAWLAPYRILLTGSGCAVLISSQSDGDISVGLNQPPLEKEDDDYVEREFQDWPTLIYVDGVKDQEKLIELLSNIKLLVRLR